MVVLRSRPIPAFNATADSFRVAYGPGSVDVTLDPRDLDDTASRIRDIRPQVIVAIGMRAAILARDEFPRVPLVYAMVPGPARRELSGAGITGISSEISPALELETCARLLGVRRRLALVSGPRWRETHLHEARDAAAGLGITLVVLDVRDPAGLADACRGSSETWDAAWLPADPDIATDDVFRFLLEFTLSRRRPLLTFAEPLVRAGALAATAPDYGWVGDRLADAVRRIQSGERPGALGAPPMRHARLVLNSATARAIGLAIPGDLMRDAEVVR